tara:strand:- start:2101 stop:2688 length:588 start_codon:yes stop_codon:yes gene_type:complete
MSLLVTAPEMETSLSNQDKKIYRYKFSKDFVFALMEFARMNSSLNRKDFKDSWDMWVKANEEMVQEEKQRLINLGYNKSVEDKMYNSVRYYFKDKYKNRGNMDMVVKKTENDQKRRKYIPLNRELLKSIDEHIKGLLGNKGEIQPKKAYEDFVEKYNELHEKEYARIRELQDLSESDVKLKIKKTYKNKFYTLTH